MNEFKICSLCLSETECIDIFSRDDQLEVDILTITGVQMKKDGDYPTGACTSCLDELDMCMEFRRKVQKSFESITAGSNFTSSVEKPKRGKKFSKDLARPKVSVSKFSYNCHKCMKAFATKSEMKFHLTRGICTFSCPKCALVFGKKPFFDYHMKSEHPEEVQETENLGADKMEDTVDVEVSGERQIEMVKVEMIDYATEEVQELESEPISEVYNCNFCNLTFATETSLTAHKIRKHNQKIEMYPCQLCTPVISFISQKALTTHTELLHPEPLKAVWEMIEQPDEDSNLMDIYRDLSC